MSHIALVEGIRTGAALGVGIVALAVAGLAPAFSWIPEVPLIVVAILLPLAAYGLTGFRVGRRSQRMLGGLLAGAVAGALSGGIGGVSYVVFGKPFLNIAVGLVVGSVGGALAGALGAQFGIRRRGADV
ncbi:MAG: hypothetical protein ABR525_02070 [Candidatus Limnocylindria bacterium]